MSLDERLMALPAHRLDVKMPDEVLANSTINSNEFVFLRELITVNRRYLIYKSVSPTIYRLVIYHINYYSPAKYDLLQLGITHKNADEMLEFIKFLGF